MPKLDFAIIASTKDAAGMNIAENLQRIMRFPAVVGNRTAGLFFTEKDVIRLENIDREIDAGVFIFASKHVSRANVHSLTVHSIGNWGNAEAGGMEGALVKAPAALMKECLRLLSKKAAEGRLDYEVVQEATHHGPYLEKPAMFIEIGSSEERWKDEAAGKAVAETIMEAIGGSGSRDRQVKAVLGLGGLHYAANFRKAMLSDALAVSYICPKHSLELLDEEMLGQAMQNSLPKADSAILDWKGLGKGKERTLQLLRSLGIAYRRTSEL